MAADSVSTFLEEHTPWVTAFLGRLVRLPTVNPPGERYGEIAALLAGELRALGLKTRLLAPPARLQRALLPEAAAYPRTNVLGRWRIGSGKKTLHFNAHTDVVPVSGEWKFGPFTPRVERGWIYGRGTADMKGAIAAFCYALAALRATGRRPLCNVEVSFTADEETDSELGAGWLVRRGDLEADCALVGEGGEGEAVCCGHNGVLWFEVEVLGRAAHGSQPELGINALEKMSALVLALEGHKRVLAKRVHLAPDGRRLRPTLNLGGVFEAGPGGKINTVPALARFSIDRRVLPMESHAAAERELRAALARAASGIPRCRIAVRKVSENFACFDPPDRPFHRTMAASVRRVRGKAPAFCVSTGFNDMQFFSHHLKVPTVGYGPGGERHHAVDERVKVAELVSAARVYADLLLTFEG